MIKSEELDLLLHHYPVFGELPPELLQRVQREETRDGERRTFFAQEIRPVEGDARK